MSRIQRSQKTNFTPRPQTRTKGTGAGRKTFQWKSRLPWLLIASEQIFVKQACSEGGLLEDRSWKSRWGLTSERLRRELEQIFPGLPRYLDSAHDWRTPWEDLLSNRVYKMFYNGTSARGSGHDPRTRASWSREHWRSWSVPDEREEIILRVISRSEICRLWKDWV